MKNIFQKRHGGIPLTKGDIMFDCVNYAFMLLVAMIFVFPLLFVISTSLMSQTTYLKYGYSFFPREIDFTAYQMVLEDSFGFASAFRDTIIVTVVGTALNLLFTAGMGYGLAKKDLPYRNLLTGFVFFTMLFSGGMIPTYMVVKGTGLLNTYWALILPGLVSPWNMFLMRNFFMAIPESLTESASLDGANEIQILFCIIIPLSLPAMATMALFYGVGHWNAWMPSLLYEPSRKINTLQYFLKTVLEGLTDDRKETIQDYLNVPTQQLKMAALVVATAPMIIIYPFIQKFFVKGLIVGSVKG